MHGTLQTTHEQASTGSTQHYGTQTTTTTTTTTTAAATAAATTTTTTTTTMHCFDNFTTAATT